MNYPKWMPHLTRIALSGWFKNGSDLTRDRAILDISRMRPMALEYSQFLNRLPRVLGYGAAAQFVLFGNRSAVVGFASSRPTLPRGVTPRSIRC